MNYITLTAQASPLQWYKTIQDAVLPYSYACEFHISGWGWAVVTRLLDDDTHYLVGVDTNGKPFVWAWDGTAYTTVAFLPDIMPTEGDIQIVFREVRLGSTDADIYHSVSLFINDRHRISYTEDHEPIAGSVRFGLAVYAGLTRTFTDLRIPELAPYADWASLDPGETGQSGMNRTTEGYYIKTILKPNGTMKAWIPKETPSVQTYTDDEIDTISERNDVRGLKTHVRMIGAYTQAEHVDDVLLRQYGHRFQEINNPYLFTEQECLEQAILAIRRMEEQSAINELSVLYRPLVEPEDHITTPYGEQIVTSRSISLNGAGGIDEGMTARKYTYG